MPQREVRTATTSRGNRTRARLIAAAGAEMELSAGALSLARAARRAGVSPAAMYRHFPSKAELAAAVVEDFFDRFDQAVFRPARVTEGTWAERECARVRKMVQFFYDDPLGPVMLAYLASDAVATAVQHRRMKSLHAGATRNLERAVATGELRLPASASVLGPAIIGGFMHALGEALAAVPRPSERAIAHDLGAFMCHAVGVQSA